jgi:hypothetical protein
MTLDDWKKTVRRNKLLGMWAAEKLGITGRDAEAYSDALAVGTLDPERSDVLSKIRKDFDAAGVVQSEEQILNVMTELTLQAGNQVPGTRGGWHRCLGRNARAKTQAAIRPPLIFGDSDPLVRRSNVRRETRVFALRHRRTFQNVRFILITEIGRMLCDVR